MNSNLRIVAPFPRTIIGLFNALMAFAVFPFAASAQTSDKAAPIYRDLFSDTWVATDALGRTLPDYKQVGPPRKDRTVGMFYFLTFGPDISKIYDNSRILQAHPEAIKDIHHPAWGPLNLPHYWGEPLFGYYRSDDDAVLRKHAHMLANADVDVIIFDNSNNVTYSKARNTLCKVFAEIRRAGGRTPQIAFLCPFGNPGYIGTQTLNALYTELYEPGLYRDLWFIWQGKPLILAAPSYADPEGLRLSLRTPAQLYRGSSLGQTFRASRSFRAVGGEFPTWATTDSGMTLSLYANGPQGKLLARQTFQRVADNAKVMLEVEQPLPAGTYYLEMSQPVGQIGWWSYSGDTYGSGKAYETSVPTTGDRSLFIRDTDQTITLSPDPTQEKTAESATARAKAMRDFFTFRTPIAPYNLTSPPPDAWAWLQIYPQAPQRSADGKIEEITVGVGQNYNATVSSTAPMSVPGAFGRSYHNGIEDTRPNAVAYGFNFDEQWKHARKIDPPFVFVTGWNEWTAGFYDQWVSWKAPPPIFVDQFNHEYSRDIEPMKGGHGDNYYYQLVDNIRRYKGVRPLPPIPQRTMSLSGNFSAWKNVVPEFRDAEGDPVRRNFPGAGDAGIYKNDTGDNDIVSSKVTYDAQTIYFYVRTRNKMMQPTGDNGMLLFLNTDQDSKTGWLGYDFIVNRVTPKAGHAIIECNQKGYTWNKPLSVLCRIQGNEMMLAIPRKALGITRLPATVDFKWADNCIARKDATDFTLNGDAAPDDRFNYRARLENSIRK